MGQYSIAYDSMHNQMSEKKGNYPQTLTMLVAK